MSVTRAESDFLTRVFFQAPNQRGEDRFDGFALAACESLIQMDHQLSVRLQRVTPHELVQAHLNVDLAFLDGLPKDKMPIV